MNKNILKKLTNLGDNEKVEKALTSFADKIFTEIKKPRNEAEIYSQLELLGEFSYRVPDKVLEMVEFVLKNKCQEEFLDKSWVNYGTVTSKCFELLKSIRYLKTEEVFDILAFLDLKVEKTREARNETLKSLLQFNFNVLKQIGLSIQRILLDKITKWGNEEKLKNIEVIKIAVKEFLQPSYEWSNMVEWNKLQFSRGSLMGDKQGNLARIRKEAIDLIFELYSLIAGKKEKFELIKILDEASRTPSSGADKSLEEIIKENIEYLLKKYKEIVFDKKGKIICSLPVAMEIARQLLWFKRRWPKEESENISNFIAKLKKDEKYFAYSEIIDRGRLDFLKDEERSEKIDLTKKIVANKRWLEILNDIAEASKIEEDWKFNDFHAFLTELAEKDVRKGEYFLKDAFKNNSSLLEFSNAFIVGFRNVGRVDLWDKYIQEIEKKQDRNLLSKILHSFYFYFKNSEKPKFREKDFSWVKSIASRKGRYSFLSDGDYNKFYFDHTLFRAIALLWKFKKKSSEDLIIAEIKKVSGDLLERKIDEIELFISWKDIKISGWDKENIEYLSSCLIKSRKMDYHSQRLIGVIGKIGFDHMLKIIKGRLDLSAGPRKTRDYYDAIPTHLEKEFIALIKENKDKFEKEMISWIVKKKPESFNPYECGSLLHQLDEIHSDIIKALIKKDTLDVFEKAAAMTRLFDGSDLNFLFEIADSVINSKKIGSKDKDKILNYISGSMFSTGLVSGEHGISNEHKKKSEEIIKIKEELKKKKKSKKLIKFADKIINSLQKQAEREYVDEERQIKLMEIDFES